jgi:hypothetical protein
VDSLFPVVEASIHYFERDDAVSNPDGVQLPRHIVFAERVLSCEPRPNLDFGNLDASGDGT